MARISLTDLQKEVGVELTPEAMAFVEAHLTSPNTIDDFFKEDVCIVAEDIVLVYSKSYVWGRGKGITDHVWLFCQGQEAGMMWDWRDPNYQERDRKDLAIGGFEDAIFDPDSRVVLVELIGVFGYPNRFHQFSLTN